MSTEIGKIKASVHLESKRDEPTQKKGIEVLVNTFYNGKELGKCVRITLPYNNQGYFHCTKKQAKKLRKLLKKSFL